MQPALAALLADAAVQVARELAHQQAALPCSRASRAASSWIACARSSRSRAGNNAPRASSVLAQGYGWCVPKAALLAAAARAAGIPARVGYADVRNHLSTERMRETMKTDLFIWHGYTDIWLDGAWRKATPAFNIELCERFGLLPLEFDGVADSIYHPFDRSGNRHMEYILQRGSYADVPLAALLADFDRHYPGLHDTSGDFLADVARETGGGA